jgi:hypothetical protein
VRTVVVTGNDGGVTKLRRTVVMLLAMAVAGACAADEGGAERGVGSDVQVETTLAPSSPPPASDETATTSRSSVATIPPTTQRQPTGVTGPPTTASPAVGGPTAPVGDDGRLGPPGAYARALLRPAPVTSIALEVIVQSGTQLRPGTVALVEDVFEESAAKDVSVATRTASDGAPSGAWDERAITAFADRHAQERASSSRAVVRFLALKGGFAADDNAIGVAVRGDVFALFVDKINGAATPLVDATTIEQAVAVHEVGHLLGLVDIALDRNRDDPDHPFHSRNRGSVMFWAIETDLVGQILNGPPPRTFDRDDRDDLAALRAGA